MSTQNPATDEGTPPCPVHPYGYHSKPRVRREGGRGGVFRHTSPIGFPARCPQLEDELESADRELDLIDELWMREHAPSGHGLAILGAALVAAVAVGLALADVATAAVVAAIVVGGLAVAGLDRGDRALHRERLRRVRDWHRRVGTPR